MFASLLRLVCLGKGVEAFFFGLVLGPEIVLRTNRTGSYCIDIRSSLLVQKFQQLNNIDCIYCTAYYII